MLFRPAAWRWLLVLLVGSWTLRADWQAGLSSPAPGDFPPLRPVKLQYECGWAGLTAGRVDAEFSRPSAGSCVLDATAATSGLARALWRLDAVHEARGDVVAIRPVSVRQKEVYRSKTIQTDLDFDDSGVERLRSSTDDKNPARKKHYDFPNLYDLQTALLYVRSQRLDDGNVYRFVVYPATAPYLATVTVLGREKVRVKAGAFPAIKLDLRLEKVTGDMRLAPHGKFKRATGWLSDDKDRIPLQMNAQLFIGAVWLELAKLE
jgi:hypothetical protein